MTRTTADDPTLRRAYWAVGAAGVIAAGAAFIFGSSFGVSPFRAALSVLVGAGVALVNLWVLARTVQNLLRPANEGGAENGAPVKWGGVAVLKFVVLLAVTFGLIRSGVVLPLGLALGFGALPFGIFTAGTFGAPRPLASQKSDHA